MTPGVIYDGRIGSYSGISMSPPTPAPSWTPGSYFTLSKEDTDVLIRMIEAFKAMEKQKAEQPPAEPPVVTPPKRPRGRPRKVPPVPTKATKTKLTVGRAPRLSAGTTALSKLWSKALAEKVDKDVFDLMTDETWP